MDDLDFFGASAKLAATDVLDVEAMKLLVRVENSGEEFYRALADRIGNEEAADLLRRNGREEVGHARRIGRAIAIKTGEPYDASPEAVERFRIPLPRAIALDLFPAIIQAEIDGDVGYQRWADCEENDEVAQLLRLNGREETVHGQRVAKALEILRAAEEPTTET
jgi:rubrerythrin